MVTHRLAIAAATTLAVLACAPAAHARDDDLATAADLRLDGSSSNDFAGAAVAGGCDANGDGRDDAVVGAFQADPDARNGAGAAYVTFGSSQRGEVDLGALGARGLSISGATAGDSLGFAVDCAGDINGDGLDDLVVGGFGADNNGRAISGSAYVVFGKRDTDPVDLAALGDGGYRIDGEAAGDRAGSAVSGAGDIDGDGLADVIVGANAADPNGRETAGRAYVVYGKRGTAPVDLASLGARGFTVSGAQAGDRAGFAVAAAGDVDADGRPDILVGAYTADPRDRETAGSAYVVFGKRNNDPVELAAPGDGGYRIDGAAAGDRFGISAAGAGDVDGDGRADLLIGADQSAIDGAGRAYISFGKGGTAPVDLASPQARGYVIEGAQADDLAGFSVDGAGDVDGDRTPDAIVGAYGADANGRNGSGSTYVVYGKSDMEPVALAGLESREDEGFRIDGAAAGDRAGRSVAGAGDFSGGGEPDVIIGADRASPRERAGAGAAYVQSAAPPPDPDPDPNPNPSPNPNPNPNPPGGGDGDGNANPSGRVQPNVSLRIASARQVRRRVKVKATGVLSNVRGRPCAGKIAVGVKSGGKRRDRTVNKVGSNCRYTVNLSYKVSTLPRRLRSRNRRLLARVTASYKGTTQLTPTRPPSQLRRVIR